TRILKTTKKFPCRIIDRGHFYFARRGQFRVPEGVKLTRLFQTPLMQKLIRRWRIYFVGRRNVNGE
ncbi:MAG: hypothetical protein OSJ56_01620, partial [Prevotella sp.]|nr:hypothetical protein [Prevotella sp.]